MVLRQIVLQVRALLGELIMLLQSGNTLNLRSKVTKLIETSVPPEKIRGVNLKA